MSNLLHETEDALTHISKLSIAVGVVNMLPDFTNMQNDNNIVSKSLKKGLLLYVADELVNEATTGSSNFRMMGETQGWKNLVDDTVFYGLGEAVDSQLNITGAVSNAVSNSTIPSSVTDAVVVGSYLYAIKWAGSKLENNVIKNVSNFFF